MGYCRVVKAPPNRRAAPSPLDVLAGFVAVMCAITHHKQQQITTADHHFWQQWVATASKLQITDHNSIRSDQILAAAHGSEKAGTVTPGRGEKGGEERRAWRDHALVCVACACVLLVGILRR